jgi:hypothetical protein
MEITSVLLTLRDALKLAKEAANAAKDTAGLAVEIREKKISAAADKLSHSIEMVEAEVGKQYGYQLCRCTLPPQVCLKIEYDSETMREISKCENCGQIYPIQFADRYRK